MHRKSKVRQNLLKQLRPFYMQNLESRKKVTVKKRCTKDRLASNMDGSVRRKTASSFILLHEKILQFDWLRAVVFPLNLKYLQVKITNLLWVVV